MAGTIGRVGVSTQLSDGNVNQAVAVLRPNHRVHPLYLSAFLNSDGGRIQFAKHRHDFGTPNINTSELAKIRVPLPPMDVQKEIAKQVEDFEAKIASARQAVAESKSQTSKFITRFLLGAEVYEDVLERLK